MKELYVIRHAKSGWEHPHLIDFERPLDDRGLREAPMMAKHLATRCPQPEALLVSPAVRTYHTAQFFRQEWQIPWDNFHLCPPIYEARADTLLAVVRDFASKVSRLALVGHNFGVSDLVNHLTGSDIELKTSCVARIQTQDSTFAPRNCQLVEHLSPKSI